VDIAPVWRVFGVTVAAEEDPGKDDFTVHPQLLAALSKKLGVRRQYTGGPAAGGGGSEDSDDDGSKAPPPPPQQPKTLPLLPAAAVRVVRKSFDARTTTKGAEVIRWVGMRVCTWLGGERGALAACLLCLPQPASHAFP
jgi:hypothetical protein